MSQKNVSQNQQNLTTIPPEALARDPISLPNPVQVPKAPVTRKIPPWMEVFIQILDAGKLNTAENPVTGLPYQTQGERDFVDQLSDRQRNSLAQTDVTQELGSVTNARWVNNDIAEEIETFRVELDRRFAAGRPTYNLLEV
jgi:hypothetical protein